MAEYKREGRWITTDTGSHVFIKKGQSVKEALDERFDENEQDVEYDRENKKNIKSKRTEEEITKKPKQDEEKQPDTPQAKIKQALKDAGYDTKKISIRKRNSGYSTAIDIEVKDPDVDVDEVEKIANKFESYDRDLATGEILLGGNTYIFTKYSDSAKEQMKNAKLEQANKVVDDLKGKAEGEIIEAGDNLYAYKQEGRIKLVKFEDRIGVNVGYAWGPEDLAIVLYQHEHKKRK